MTRKDYIVIADILKEIKKVTTPEVFTDVSFIFAKKLDEKFGNFNKEYFKKYLNK